MGIGAFLKRHSLIAGLLAVLLPLSVLLIVQFVWLARLEKAQAIAHAAALDSFLGTVSTKVEYFYREAAERSLNLSASLFTQGRIEKVAYYWKQRPAKGAKRLFLVDLTQNEFGNFLAFDQENATLYTPAASDESLAMVLAANPLHMLNLRQRGMESAALTVDERNPDYRIILNPILDDGGRVVGLAGMVLDEDYLRKKLLPSIITATLAKFLPSAPDGELAVTVTNGAGATVVAVGDAQGRGVAANSRLGFVFTDWQMALYNPRATPRQWARAGFVFNASLAVLLALALIGGVALALRAADRAVKLSRMKSDFVSNVSHELRTPVASIRVFGELLRLGRAQDPEKVREYGEHIEGESRRLTRLIDNILDFSRIESGRKEYRFETGDVRDVVDGVIRTFEMRSSAAGLSIVRDLPEGPVPPVRMDADAIAQAFQNLLDNAVKYANGSKEIRVTVSVGAGSVAVAVRDSGIGIPRDEQRKIFERFHRVGTGLVHDVKGSGLGLSIVHHIVEAHGGTVAVESEPGSGSTFTIRLPVEGERRLMPKVVIVEDDAAMAAALKDGFAYEGYDVELARDGEAGLKLAREASPDIVILDVMLPRMSGLDVCKRLRSEGSALPIIMLTARGQEIDKVVGLKLGADDYVTKPFGFMELMARVEALLRRASGGARPAEVYGFGDVVVDFKKAEVKKKGLPLEITARELKLLQYFIAHRGEVVPRERLLDQVWEYDDVPLTRTVDMHVAKLRKKIETDPADPKFLITVHRMGYKFTG